ncbi:MAG: hypothetical protein V4598_00845 [Bdellovibrionota bacterium]
MSMEEVALVSNREEFVSILRSECRSLIMTSPLTKSTLEEFKSFLDIFQAFNMLIIDADQESENKLFEFVETSGAKIKHIMIFTKRGLRFHPRVSYHKSINSLLEHIRRLVQHQKSEQSGFASAPLEVFRHFKFVPFDLYIKCSPYRYVRRVHAYDELDPGFVESLSEKGVEHIYFDRKYNKTFSNLLINNLINRVEKDYQSMGATVSALDEVYKTARGIVRSLGFKPRIVEVCESVMEKITETIHASQSNLVEYLMEFSQDHKISLKYRLVELTCLLALRMLEEGEDKEEGFKKIVFAAFFCDIGLSDPGHIHVRKNSQLEIIDVDLADQIRKHALVSSEIISSYENAPSEVGIIITQHHGSLTGIGFPETFDENLHPLAKCFITAQGIAYQILMDQSVRPMDKILSLKGTYMDTTLEIYYANLIKGCFSQLKEVPWNDHMLAAGAK